MEAPAVGEGPGRLTARTWPIAAAMLPFASPTAHDGPPSAWRDALSEVGEAGFDLVDLTDNWVRPGDLGPEGLHALTEAAADAGVRFASLSSIRRSVVDAEHAAENLAYGHRTLEAAAALGVGTVSMGLHQKLTPAQQRQLWFWVVEGHRDRPEDWPLAVDRLRELGRHAAELGIVMSLEMYEDTFVGTADSAVRLVEEIGLANVGLNPDIGNLVRLHRPVERGEDVIRTTARYVNFWHVKNYFRDEDPAKGVYFTSPAPLESGVIDYRSSLRIAIEGGFQGVICAEHYGGDGLSVCATNREYLRRHALPKRPDYRLGESSVVQPDVTDLVATSSRED